MRVLLLAYEGEGCSMCLLATRLRQDGHEVKLVQGDYYTFLDDVFIRDFYADHGCDDYVTFEAEYRKLYEESPDVDWEFLRDFEDRYCTTKNVQQLMLSDPIITRHHHFRYPYYTPIKSEEQRYYWTELLLRWTERLITGFDPDLVFTYGRNYFVKNTAAQITTALDIPMWTLIRSRVGDYCHMSNEFGYGTDRRIKRAIRDDDWDDLSDAREYLEQFRSTSEGGLYDATSQQRRSRERLYTVDEILGGFGRGLAKLGYKCLRGAKRKYRGGAFAYNYFNSTRPAILGFRARRAYNRLRYIFGDKFGTVLPDRPFVYFPLHTLPESSTLTLSTEYFERDLLRFVSKELPAGMVLVVKENPNMIGPRPFDYYDDIEELPNARLLDPKVSSKRLIRESNGVCGISGTALLEAAILDTPTHCFGWPEFRDIVDYHGHEEFGDFAAACRQGDGARNPERVLRYLQYVADHGRELKYDAIRGNPEGNRDAFESGIEVVYEMVSSISDRLEYEEHDK